MQIISHTSKICSLHLIQESTWKGKNAKKKASDNFAFGLNQELVFTDVRWWYQIMDSVNSIDNIDE